MVDYDPIHNHIRIHLLHEWPALGPKFTSNILLSLQYNETDGHIIFFYSKIHIEEKFIWNQMWNQHLVIHTSIFTTRTSPVPRAHTTQPIPASLEIQLTSGLIGPSYSQGWAWSPTLSSTHHVFSMHACFPQTFWKLLEMSCKKKVFKCEHICQAGFESDTPV